MKRFWVAAVKPLVDELWAMRHPVTYARKLRRGLTLSLDDITFAIERRRELR